MAAVWGSSGAEGRGVQRDISMGTGTRAAAARAGNREDYVRGGGLSWWRTSFPFSSSQASWSSLACGDGTPQTPTSTTPRIIGAIGPWRRALVHSLLLSQSPPAAVSGASEVLGSPSPDRPSALRADPTVVGSRQHEAYHACRCAVFISCPAPAADLLLR